MPEKLYNRSLQILTDTDMHLCILVIFYVLLINSMFSYDFLLRTMMLMVSIAIYLSYIFFVNDYYDMPYDIGAGKKRLVQDIPKSYSLWIMIGMMSTSLLCLFAIADQLYAALYLITCVVGTFYSAPPVRFKGRKILGIVADVLIERTLPLLLIFLFFRYLEWDAILFLLAFSVLQFEMIVHHQIEDHDADLKTGINTFVVMIGHYKALHLLKRFIQPLTGVMLFLIYIVIAYKMKYMGIPILLMFFGYFPLSFIFSKGILKQEETVIPSYLKYLFLLSVSVIPLYLGMLLIYQFYLYIVLFLVFAVSIYPDLSQWKRRIVNAFSSDC